VSGCGELDRRAEEPPATQPNLVLIVADTLRQDYLGAYGFAGDVSLAIDRFAKGSVLFENGISPAPWTKPSVTSIFTSLPPEAHGLVGIRRPGSERRFQVLNERVPTLAGELQRAGYETVALYANAWLDPASGLGRGFDRYEKVEGGASGIATLALDLLGMTAPDRPLFLYLHFMDPHGPYTCDQQHFRKLRDSPSLGSDQKLTSDEQAELGYLAKMETPWLKDTGVRDSRSYWRACYAANVAAFDAQLVPLLRSLTAGPRAADTAVIFTSDHGEALLDHPAGRLTQRAWEHGWNLHFHQTRVPMLVRLPGGRLAGMRVKTAVTGLDVAPTLLALAGLLPPASMRGQDLLTQLEPAGSQVGRWVFSSGVKRRHDMLSLQNHRYKMIINTKNNRVALYDLQEDPAETKDVAAHNPELVEELRGIVAARSKALGELNWLPEQAGSLNPAIAEELRALGYLEE
jgi:arylsulfatase